MTQLLSKTHFRSCVVQHFQNFHFSKSANQTVEETCSTISSSDNRHCYKKLFPWKSVSEFSNHLLSCVVYNKGGVFAINKPYGVKIYRSKGNEKKSSSGNLRYEALLSSIPDFPYSVEDALPYLRENLDSPNLSILKSAERYGSGIVLLSANEKTSRKITKSFNIAKNLKKPHLVYWVITRGYPVVPMRQEKVGIKMVDVGSKNEKQPIIVTDFSRRDVLFKRVKTFLVDYRTLCINKELSCSLLEMAVSAASLHFVRVYASSRAASVLGDLFYGSRMRTLLGVPVKINPQNMVAYDITPLPELMCEKLKLPKSVEGHLLVPSMLHLQTIILPRFEKDQEVHISAKPPPHFQWTCAQLNLLPMLS